MSKILKTPSQTTPGKEKARTAARYLTPQVVSYTCSELLEFLGPAQGYGGGPGGSAGTSGGISKELRLPKI